MDYLRRAETEVEKAAVLTQVKIAKKAKVFALRNAQKQFTGRNDRRLSGGLFNAIYEGVEDAENGGNIPDAFVGVRNIPYGAIHEFGGEIEPVKAQKLWIPVYKYAGRMTPREFMQAMARDPRRYFITDKVAGRRDNLEGGNLDMTPLFWRVDQVEIPERPYLRPAIGQASEEWANVFIKTLDRLLERDE